MTVPVIWASLTSTLAGETSKSSLSSHMLASCHTTSQNDTAQRRSSRFSVLFFIAHNKIIRRKRPADGFWILLRQHFEISRELLLHLLACDQYNIALWHCLDCDCRRNNVIFSIKAAASSTCSLTYVTEAS